MMHLTGMPRQVPGLEDRTRVRYPRRVRVWVQGTVAIDMSSITAETARQIKAELTLIHRSFDGECTAAPFYLDYGDGWLHVPRGWFYNAPKYASFTSQHNDNRSDGFPLAPGTCAHVTFGQDPFPSGQPQFIDQIVTNTTRFNGGLCLAPTRAGKTLCALEAACRLGRSTLILVNNGELMKQWAQNVEQHLRVPCGIIRQDRWDVGRPFTVAMTHTLVNRPMDLEARRQWGTVIVDECDSAPCKTYWTALHRVHARYVLGLSATPDRKDGLGEAIEWIVGKPIASLHRKLEAEVCWIPFRWTGGKITKRGRTSWVDAEKEMMDDYSRVNKLAELAVMWNRSGRNVLVMAGIVEHLSRIADAVRAQGGDPGLFVGGNSTAEQRDKGICLTSYQLASKGVDFKMAPNLFIPAGPRADIRQAAGRALQPQVEVTTRILDPADLHPALMKWARKRGEFYHESGFRMLNEIETLAA